jgi:hypothetical protein
MIYRAARAFEQSGDWKSMQVGTAVALLVMSHG